MHQPSYKKPDDGPDVICRSVDVPELCLEAFVDLAEDVGAVELDPTAKFKADGTKWRRIALEIPPDDWRRVPVMPTDHDTPRIHPEHLR